MLGAEPVRSTLCAQATVDSATIASIEKCSMGSLKLMTWNRHRQNILRDSNAFRRKCDRRFNRWTNADANLIN